MRVLIPFNCKKTAFFCPSPLPFGGSTVLSLTLEPTGSRTTTGSLSATQECRDTNCTTRTAVELQENRTDHFFSFFFPPVWPIRTRLGPYICVSNEKQKYTRTRVVQKRRQIITKPKTNKKQQNHHNQKRPANPPARFALRLKAKQRSNKERGRAQQTNTFRFALDTVTLATVSSSKTCKLIIHGGSA